MEFVFCQEERTWGFPMNINNLKVLLTSLPGRYAAALFNEGKKIACLDEISDDFQKLDIFLKNNIQMKKILTSSWANEKELSSSWIEVGESLSFCPVFLSFIRAVLKNRRFGLFGEMWHIFNIALTKYKNKRDISVVSVVELLPEQKERIKKVLEKIVAGKAIIKYEIDERILGGIQIKSEEIVIDASISVQLKQLSSYLKNTKIKD